MQDRSVRTLVRLQSSGSTSRLLNLVLAHNAHGEDEEHAANPFFKSPILNKAIIVKHRLRGHEHELFKTHRLNATKLILPLDTSDLRTGGRSAFFGQRGWEPLLASLAPGGGGAHLEADRRTFELLDAIPSFDPFLLREHLRRANVTPADSYFDISPADTELMFAFLEAELEPLVRLTTGTEAEELGASTTAIVKKLMSPAAEEAFGPLGRTLRMSPEQYSEGVFCWKGFLYYKWRMDQHAQGLPRLLERIRLARTVGPAAQKEKSDLAKAKSRVSAALKACSASAAELLKVYDGAFALMVLAQDPTAFRDFLLDAPPMFVKLGDAIGAIDHVDGFWDFRFPDPDRTEAPIAELIELLQDFEESLAAWDAPALELAS